MIVYILHLSVDSVEILDLIGPKMDLVLQENHALLPAEDGGTTDGQTKRSLIIYVTLLVLSQVY